MKIVRSALWALLALMLGLGGAGAARASAIVDIYLNQYHDTGSGFTITGTPTSTETWSVISSPIVHGDWSWMADQVFTADIRTTISVAADGTYGFTLISDDGSYAYIDGALVGLNGGIHGASPVSFFDFLTAGDHQLEVVFGNALCCGSGVQVDFHDPVNVTYAADPVPEPASLALLGAGLAGLGFIRRRRHPAGAVTR